MTDTLLLACSLDKTDDGRTKNSKSTDVMTTDPASSAWSGIQLQACRQRGQTCQNDNMNEEDGSSAAKRMKQQTGSGSDFELRPFRSEDTLSQQARNCTKENASHVPGNQGNLQPGGEQGSGDAPMNLEPGAEESSEAQEGTFCSSQFFKQLSEELNYVHEAFRPVFVGSENAETMCIRNLDSLITQAREYEDSLKIQKDQLRERLGILSQTLKLI